MFQPIRTEIKKLFIITDQSLYFLLYGKFLKDFFLSQYSSILMKIIFHLKTSLDFDLLTYVSFNYYLLTLTYMHPLVESTLWCQSDLSLDLSIVFDRVWHEWLIYKIQCCGIKCYPLILLQIFLKTDTNSLEWPNIRTGASIGWCIVGLHFGIIVFPYLYKKSN